MVDKTIYVGPFVHSKSFTELDICEAGVIGVDEHGKIAFVERDKDVDFTKHGEAWQKAERVDIKGEGFFFPGFIDTHTHAPQFPNAGIFGSSTLLSWLETYTFPMESRYKDLTWAQRVYTRVVSRLLSHGTTTAAYYATIHVPATTLLARIALEKGQRAFVGRVCMDRMSPEYCRDESPESAVRDSELSVKEIRELDPSGELVAPVITPRFAPSCTSESMKGLGELAKREDVVVQTHVSENVDEIKLVKKLFPDSSSYTGVYDDHGLLGTKIVLAHAVHLSEDERKLIKQRSTKLAHCPCSNTCLSSGAAKVKQLIRDGIDVGLGTDVAGAYSPSILEEVRQAILVSRHVALTDGDEAKVSYQEALWLATRGGARVVGLEKKVGGFEVGMDFDAQMVVLNTVPEDGTLDVSSGAVDLYGHESWEDKVAKWVYSGDDRNTSAVWVKGRLVHSR